ncbi:MAG: ATP-binding protein [Myxococcota bacterium]
MSSRTEEEARLRTILNSMVEAVFVTDEKGRVTLTNRALDDLIAEDVRGQRAKNVIKSNELRVAIRRARKKDKATEVQLETVIGDRTHIFQAQVAPLPDQAGVVTVLHNVTSLKDADRMRRDFVANASHELRTPLTAIRGFAETLLDGAAEEPELRARFLEAIFRHTIRLQRLAEDLTSLAQAESPDYELEDWPVDLRDVCTDSVSSLDQHAQRKSVKVQLALPGEPVRIQVSTRAIEHVLINLVDNAIKYSPPDSEVTVRLLPADPTQEDGHVSIEVEDHGPGIPAKYRPRIFERFYRVDKGRSRQEGGTGLGLSIAKNLVERIGGTIELESEVDKGTLFRVNLPPESPE